MADLTDCDESRPIEDPYEPHWSIRGCAIAAGGALGINTANVTVSYSSPPSTTSSGSAPRASPSRTRVAGSAVGFAISREAASKTCA